MIELNEYELELVAGGDAVEDLELEDVDYGNGG